MSAISYKEFSLYLAKMTADHWPHQMVKTNYTTAEEYVLIVENPLKGNILLPVNDSESCFWAIYHVMNHIGSK